ncbi:hypothetical protein CFC21_080307 [Triticum aestivum]|uniref:Uncharacterized protein n=2 Tax=Triticum aestivum TaxID=4565 RepID=A0A3B6N0Q4_WHEAT|nr:hypothetical protein CFC21_080307 [Triticum aestivum]
MIHTSIQTCRIYYLTRTVSHGHRPGVRRRGRLAVVVLAGELLERDAVGLGRAEGEAHAQEVAGGEDEERVPHPDAGLVPVVHLGRVLVLRQVQEPERPNDGPQLPGGGGDAVARRPEPRREDLRRHDEGGGVGPEVGEEEGERVQHHEPDVVPRRRPVVVREGEAQHEDGHEEEAAQLDPEPPDPVDQRHREPVARHRAAERDERLRARDAVHLLEGAHLLGLGDQVDRREDVLLEQVLRVEGDVEQEPAGGRAEEVQPVPAQELAGEEPERVAVVGGSGAAVVGLGVLFLGADLHLEHLGHVGRGLLGVLGDERRVARSLGHLHPPVVGHQGRDGAEHEDEAPHEVGLRRRGGERAVLVGGRGEGGAEGGGDDERDDAAGEDAEALHRKDGGDEGAPRLLVGVLGHDGGGERVVAADAEAEPEAEEAERGHDGAGGGPEGQPGGDGAEHHAHERHAVDALAAHAVAEPAEEELAGERAAEGDAVDGGGDVGRERAGGVGALPVVVDAAEQLGDEGDAEEVVGVGEEAHAGDDDGREVVPLRLGRVQRRQHLQLLARHRGEPSLIDLSPGIVAGALSTHQRSS